MAAAHEMHVVGIAVVGRADGDDGLEGRRPARGDLQPVEAAPGDSNHPDLAVAPCLRREPGDGLDGVVLLLLGIFVVDHPLGIAAAADVEAQARIAMARDIGMGQLVALRVPSRRR